jgi:hypothetical protein
MTTKLSEFHKFSKNMLNSFIDRWINFSVNLWYFFIPLTRLFILFDNFIDGLDNFSLNITINYFFFRSKLYFMVDPFALFEIKNWFSIFIQCVFFSSHHNVFERLFNQKKRFVIFHKSLFYFCF